MANNYSKDEFLLTPSLFFLPFPLPLFSSFPFPTEVASSYERKFFARFRKVEEEEQERDREREKEREREREKERENEEDEGRSSLTISGPRTPREERERESLVGGRPVSSFYSSPFSVANILEGVERGKVEREMRG